IKLAARFGVGARRRTLILSTDVRRIAASDQLRSLASILGIGCDLFETPEGLRRALDAHQNEELILIDTAGVSLPEMEHHAGLADFSTSNPEIEVQLVLPASMKSKDAARIGDAYAIFKPNKLIFTKLDETQRFGSLVSEAARRS